MRIFALLRVLLTISICVFSIVGVVVEAQDSDGKHRREMRGIWVATVNNIDWPSSPALSIESLERETIAILDRVQQLGLNTVFLQVRPCSDAIYNSSLEPLSYYLTGMNPPEGYERRLRAWDALSFWISEAHKRGLELHAWINPFRAGQTLNYPSDDSHVSKQRPEWTIRYGNKLFLDPGREETRRYVVDVVREIVEKYDVDGIHLDDYFYPYPVGKEVFNDSVSFAQQNIISDLGDWRRNNVSSLIAELNGMIHSLKPQLEFGVSPFGVWRNERDDPKGSQTRAGITNYDILYADIVGWIDREIVDYVIPQVYWESGNKAADFDVLTKWWAEKATEHTRVYIGHALFKVNQGDSTWGAEEISSQIEKVRMDERLSGSVFFSYRQLNRDLQGLQDCLATQIYSEAALTPERSSADGCSIEIESIRKREGAITWDCSAPDSVRFYVVEAKKKGDGEVEELLAITSESCIALPRLESRTSWYISVHPVDFRRRVHWQEYKKRFRY